MKPNFAALTFNADGDIYVNDEYKAAGAWPGRLAPGVYKVEVRKQGHRSSFTTIEAKAGETRTIALEAPVPVYGSLNITANVTAQIYVDDKPTGEVTPYLMNKVLVGSHSVELRADGYQSHKQTVEIQEGKTANIQSELQKPAPAPIRTMPGCATSDINLGKVKFVSDKTWTFGEQTWSAPITATYCEKTTFDGGSASNYRVDCRMHPQTKYGHLFTWCMVASYAAQLCPSPWRVPSQADFSALVSNTNYRKLIYTWDYGGYASSTSVYGTGSQAYYWSSTAYSGNISLAFNLHYNSGNLSVSTDGKHIGFQVRCVK
jgi:hypothetical protein